MTILLAASSSTLEKFIIKSLEIRGDEILIAKNEEEIYKIINNNIPQIILLQGSLWDKSGFEVCFSLQKFTQIPIIIFSSAQDIQEKYIQCHSSDYLEIPFSLDTLYNKIDLLVQNTKSILIVEDSDITRKNIAKNLKDRGFNIVEASDGEEGYKKLLKEDIDIVLSDIEMPKMNGYELCKKIKSNTETNYIPVILISSLSTGLFIDRGFQAGADKYLPKPLDIELLISTINKIFSEIYKVNRERILFIDEKNYLFNQFKTPLVNQGFIVYNAKKVSEAIPIIQKENINVLIIQEELLDLLGIKFIKRIHTSGLILIILLNRNSRKTISKIKAANILYYTSKPFTPEKIVGIVERAVTDNQRIKELNATKQYMSEAAFASAQQLAKKKVKKYELRAEERTLTILFSDIVGFSTLCESLETTQIVQFLNGYFDIMADILKSNGALIDKYIGDAIMALFDPLKDKGAHFKALKSAFEMQKVLKVFNKNQNRQDNPVQMRIGINTGSVIWGDVGSIYDRRDTTVIGDNVNISQRLESICPPNGILISDSTYKLVKDKVIISKIEETHVKGKNKSVKVHHIKGLKILDEIHYLESM